MPRITRQQKRVRLRLAIEQKWHCALCGLHMNSWDVSLDHKRPRSHNGKNRINNYQATHIRCNEIRGAMPLIQWYITLILCFPELYATYSRVT